MVAEGYRFAAPPLIIGAILLWAGWGFGWARVLGIVALLLALFIFYFFRDPERAIPSEPNAVVSPADGRVVEIVEEPWQGRAGRRVSIFLSIWDVHVNRAPLAGQIRHIEYHPGKFYAALRSRASTENEQNVISLSTPRGDMLFKQIAGAIARRVLCWKREGARVACGERVGMIRFGSRVDVWLPMEAEILVRQGQKVAGGSSIIARWNTKA